MPKPLRQPFREESFGDKVRRAANDPSAGREERPPGEAKQRVIEVLP